MSRPLNKHLLQCTSTECGEVFYVLNDAASESQPVACPFCRADAADYNPVPVLRESEDETPTDQD